MQQTQKTQIKIHTTHQVNASKIQWRSYAGESSVTISEFHHLTHSQSCRRISWLWRCYRKRRISSLLSPLRIHFNHSILPTWTLDIFHRVSRADHAGAADICWSRQLQLEAGGRDHDGETRWLCFCECSAQILSEAAAAARTGTAAWAAAAATWNCRTLHSVFFLHRCP